MANISLVTEALSKTAKGMLKYDTTWFADGDLEVRVLSPIHYQWQGWCRRRRFMSN